MSRQPSLSGTVKGSRAIFEDVPSNKHVHNLGFKVHAMGHPRDGHTTPHWFINTLRPRQNGRHLPDDIFKYISLNENVWISIEISLKFVRKGSINNIPALVLIMAWRRSGDKPLSGPMMVRLPTHICVTRPQWVKLATPNSIQFSINPESIYDGMTIPLLKLITGMFSKN